MDGGVWWAAVHGVSQSWTRLSDFTFTFHLHALEKEMETHSSVLGWRIPGMVEPGGLPSMGLHRVGHDWSDLAAAAATFQMKGGNRWKGESAWPALLLHPLGTIPSLLYLTLTTHNPWGHLTLTTHNPWYDTESHQCSPFHTLVLTQTRLPPHPASQTTSPHLQIQPQNQYHENPCLLTRAEASPSPHLPPHSASGYLARIQPHPSFLPTSRKNFRQKLYLCIPRNSTQIELSRSQRGDKKQICQPWTVEKKRIAAFGFNLGKEGASHVALMAKNPPAHAGDAGLIPGSGRSPGGRNGHPLSYSCLEGSHGQRSQAGYSSWGQKSWTRLSFWALGEKAQHRLQAQESRVYSHLLSCAELGGRLSQEQLCLRHTLQRDRFFQHF